MKKDILNIQNVTKTFAGVKALNNVSLSVKEGEVHALMGENGAGKSTLIKILTGISVHQHRYHLQVRLYLHQCVCSIQS